MGGGVRGGILKLGGGGILTGGKLGKSPIPGVNDRGKAKGGAGVSKGRLGTSGLSNWGEKLGKRDCWDGVNSTIDTSRFPESILNFKEGKPNL